MRLVELLTWRRDVRRFRSPNPQRFVALGRDTAASIDVQLGEAATPGFQNEGDNEPTGLYVSDGSRQPAGLLGTVQNPARTRAFFTQQHGENRVYEIIQRGGSGFDRDDW